MSNFNGKARLLRGAALAGVALMGCAAVAGDAATKKAAASGEVHQVVTGPVAEYWIDTTTSSGMSLSGLSGGGRPSMSSIMGMMKGGASYSMHLSLGSHQVANGDPQADHLPPAALDAGPDLPLYYKPPVAEKETYTPTERSEPDQQQQETPKGKILIYWGCGEHAPKDQPVVIDLSKLTDPTQRMGMMSRMMPTPISLDVVTPPDPEHWKSFGEWPNEKSTTGLKPDSSLVGAHSIKGNYSPQIDFTLDPTQNFLDPIAITNNVKDQQGAVPLAWKQIAQARGFFTTAIGAGVDDGNGGNTIVMWTSASSQTSAMGAALGQYLTPHDIERLLAQKVILPGDATTCTVPAEVANAGRGVMYSLTAFGGETNMAYPPRPEDPHTPWNIAWETKIRYRSSIGGILGQTMGGGGGMFGNGGGDDSQGSSSSSSSSDGQPKKKSSMFGNMLKQGLGSLIPGGG